MPSTRSKFSTLRSISLAGPCAYSWPLPSCVQLLAREFWIVLIVIYRLSLGHGIITVSQVYRSSYHHFRNILLAIFDSLVASSTFTPPRYP